MHSKTEVEQSADFRKPDYIYIYKKLYVGIVLPVKETFKTHPGTCDYV